MKKGEIYVCEHCGLELQVIKECKDSHKPAEDCGCHPEGSPCTFSCCGEDMVKK
ncbi:MAG: hypothetical protein V2J62_01740 [candidate division KSB1 bacterium]|jgi:hypothetical protein|nr:hypothetical protein [candidate division KSB1 bacterium]